MTPRILLPWLLCATIACDIVEPATTNAVSFRGLQAGPNFIWASGTQGCVKISKDQGATWHDVSIPGANNLDLRDIHGLGDGIAIAMSAGPNQLSQIHRTTNGGQTWQEVARCQEGFWDSLDFWKNGRGLLVGDPINGRLDLWQTEDAGKTWQQLPLESRPEVEDGEYCFAASGTSLCLLDNGRAWLATGGSRSRVFISEDFGQSWVGVETPLNDPSPGSGIYSIHMRDPLNGLIVGGDYEKPNKRVRTAARTRDGGRTWQLMNDVGINGYRSCVQWSDGIWRTTGINGSELSWDDGESWHEYAAGRGFNSIAGRVLAGDRDGLQLPRANAAIDKPNILFFLVDDLGWQDTSIKFSDQEHQLNQRFATPAIQKLAESGVKFSQAYAASPVCSPTRVSIMTGLNPAHSGVSNWIPGEADGGPKQQRWALPNWNSAGLNSTSPTLPRVLQQHGYQTAHLGKAHFGSNNSSGGNPLNLGFDVNVGGSHIGHPGGYFPPYGKVGSSHQVPGLDDLRDSQLYLSDALTNKASAILDSFASTSHSAPFFINMSHYAVHTPVQPDYRTMVESVDRSLGALTQQLEQLGIADNTIVIFFSDNGGLVTHAGPPTSCEPLAGGKGTMREGGTRVPLVIKWPGYAQANQRIDTPVISDDFMPTLLEAAGLSDYEGDCDGASILPLLKGDALQTRDLIWHWPHYWAGRWLRDKFDVVAPFSAIRRGDWKLVWRWDDQRAELYNLANDLSEQHNLIEQEPQIARDLCRGLRDKLMSWNAPRPRNHQSGDEVPWPLLPQVLNEDGGWCWFQDERAVTFGDHVIFGSVATGWHNKNRKGDIDLSKWNPRTGEIKSIKLHHQLQADDHDAPALLVNDDGQLLSVFAKHGNDPLMRVRRGPLNDFSKWKAEQQIQIPKTKVGVTYTNLFQLGDRTLNFFRGINWNPTLIESDDFGASWELKGRLLGGPGRPYLKYQSDGELVHFVATDQHPRDFNNNLYHGVLRGMEINASDGSLIGKVGSSPPAPSDLSIVFQGSENAVAWPCDLEIDPATQLPICLFSVQVDGANMKRGTSGMDHRFYYATWDGNAWQCQEIAHAGTRLYAGEDDYTGLAAIDPDNPRRVIISTDADPLSGVPLLSNNDQKRHRELYEGLQQPDGSWQWDALTMDSKVDNVRPIIPAGTPKCLLWLSGKMQTYTNYQFRVMGTLLAPN